MAHMLLTQYQIMVQTLSYYKRMIECVYENMLELYTIPLFMAFYILSIIISFMVAYDFPIMFKVFIP